MLSARAPPGVRGWGGGRGPSELGCEHWSLGCGKDSALRRRCAVLDGEPVRVRSGPGGGPPTAGRWSPETLRGGRVLPPSRTEGCPAGDAEQSPRTRGGQGTVRVPGCGGPRDGPARQVRRGALRRAAPPGAGKEDGSGEWGRTGRGPVVPGAARNVRVGGAAPPGAGRRGGREAPALTSRGPAGDGGSGHSTPHRPPPAPADSGVRRHCARGGASQLRGWGSGREPGVSTRGALGGALAGGTRLPGPRARRRDGLPGSPGRGSSAEGQDAGSRRRKLGRST